MLNNQELNQLLQAEVQLSSACSFTENIYETCQEGRYGLEGYSVYETGYIKTTTYEVFCKDALPYDISNGLPWEYSLRSAVRTPFGFTYTLVHKEKVRLDKWKLCYKEGC